LPSEMDIDLKKIERLLVKPKEWKHMGEVDRMKRPKNSLLSQKDIDFKQGIPLAPLSSKQNDEIERVTIQRIREGTFDNHEFKAAKEVEVVEEVYETTNLELNDIIMLYNEIEGDLMKITDFGNGGFVPDSEIKIAREEAPKPMKKRKVGSLSKIRNVTVIQ
jgi:U3 small nucleolar RNA-associated protein MPP10